MRLRRLFLGALAASLCPSLYCARVDDDVDLHLTASPGHRNLLTATSLDDSERVKLQNIASSSAKLVADVVQDAQAHVRARGESQLVTTKAQPPATSNSVDEHKEKHIEVKAEGHAKPDADATATQSTHYISAAVQAVLDAENKMVGAGGKDAADGPPSTTPPQAPQPTEAPVQTSQPQQPATTEQLPKPAQPAQQPTKSVQPEKPAELPQSPQPAQPAAPQASPGNQSTGENQTDQSRTASKTADKAGNDTKASRYVGGSGFDIFDRKCNMTPSEPVVPEHDEEAYKLWAARADDMERAVRQKDIRTNDWDDFSN
eukprot:TRINITY_DN101289_c0_g1_i1.p1 TRINITY_DN101289_c0_g1~~TRINITY_DN101289_c0_g1_i1.p1  ORF type:complete len:316 (+),score=74.99 TRINITY_DN101289_c0_g1_i1:86-1033(+)